MTQKWFLLGFLLLLPLEAIICSKAEEQRHFLRVGFVPAEIAQQVALNTQPIMLRKLLSESVENIDKGVVEAVRATGAGHVQIVSFAVLSQILPDLISFTLYRLETNIRAAAVLGLIGAGGIGFLMNTSFRTFQFQEAAIVSVLIVLVMLVDYASYRLRRLIV